MAKALDPFENVPVLLDELVGACGGSHEATGFWIRQAGVTVLEDWQGRSALRFGDARRVFAAWQGNREEHDRQWIAYQSWLHERKSATAAAKLAELRRHREDAEQALTDGRRRFAERAAAQAEEEYARITAANAAARVPDFDTWKRTNGAAQAATHHERG